MTNYPTGQDNLITLPGVSGSTEEDTAIEGLRSAVFAIEQELGLEPSGIYSDLRVRMDVLEARIGTVSGSLGAGGGSGTPITLNDGYLNSPLLLVNAPQLVTLTIAVGNGAPTAFSADGSIYMRADGYNDLYVRRSGVWVPLVDQILAGDVTGNISAVTVGKLKGKTLSTTLSTIGVSQDGYVLTWVNGSSEWQAKSPSLIFTAGGDLSGTATSQTVNKIKGTTVTTAGGSLLTGSVLRATAGGVADWGTVNLASTNAVTGVLPISNQASQTMVGDVSGTTAASVVDKLKGKNLSTTLSTIGVSQDGYTLTWVNSANEWQAKVITGTTSQATASGTITAGYAICSAGTSDSTAVVPCTLTNFLASGTPRGIALTNANNGTTVTYAGPGTTVSASVMGLGTGSGIAVVNPSTGAVTKITAGLITGGEIIIGSFDGYGNCVVEPQGRQIARPVIHLQDPKYGAKFDGVTDDTAAWLAAIEDCGAGGTIVVSGRHGAVTSYSVVSSPLDIATTLSELPQTGIQFIADGAQINTNSYSVSILNKVKDFEGTQLSIISKNGNLLRVSIPQADWAAAMLVSKGSSLTYAEPADLFNIPFELKNCNTNTNNDYFQIARIVNDNRDGSGAIVLDLYDISPSNLSSATDTSSGSIDWRAWRHLFGVYNSYTQFINIGIIQDASSRCSVAYDVTEWAGYPDTTWTNGRWDSCGVFGSGLVDPLRKLKYGWHIGRAISRSAGRLTYMSATGAGTFTARANNTVMSIGQRRVAVGKTTSAATEWEVTAVTGDAKTGASEPITFKDGTAGYSWGASLVETTGGGSVTWKAMYAGSTPIASQIARANLTAYAVNDVRFCATSSGRSRQMRWRCIVAGTSGASEPAEFTTNGATKGAPKVFTKVTDGTVTWISEYDAAPPSTQSPYNVDFCTFKSCIGFNMYCMWLHDNASGQSREHVWEDCQVVNSTFCIATPTELRNTGASSNYIKVNWNRGSVGGIRDSFLYAKSPGNDCQINGLYTENGGRIVYGSGGFNITFNQCTFTSHTETLIALNAFELDCPNISFQDTNISIFGSTDFTPIYIGQSNYTGTGEAQSIKIQGGVQTSSSRRGTPARMRSTRREPFRCIDGYQIQVVYTTQQGSSNSTQTLTSTLVTADCADITRATALEIAARLNADTSSLFRWWADGWGYLWVESIASGSPGLQSGNEIISCNAGNLNSAIGFVGLSCQTYAPTQLMIDSNYVISPTATGNGVSLFPQTNFNLDFNPQQMRDGYTGAWVRCDSVRRSYIGSGMAANTDWGKSYRSLEITSQQSIPVKNPGGTITFFDNITSVPIVFANAEENISYDIHFDVGPKSITGTPTIGLPVVPDGYKSIYGCRVNRMFAGLLVAPGIGNSETISYTVVRRNAIAWTPQSSTALTLKGWYKNEDLPNGKVSSWANSATGTNLLGALVQTNSAIQPIAATAAGPAGRNKVTFNGIDGYLKASLTTPYTQPFVMIWAMKWVSGTGRIFSRASSSLFISYDTSVPKIQINAGSTADHGGAAWATSTTDHVLGVMFDNTIYPGGGVTTYGWLARKNSAPVSSQGWISLGTNSLDGLIVGADWTPSHYANAVVYEGIILTVTPGATRLQILDDIQRCERYLMNKFEVGGTSAATNAAQSRSMILASDGYALRMRKSIPNLLDYLPSGIAPSSVTNWIPYLDAMIADTPSGGSCYVPYIGDIPITSPWRIWDDNAHGNKHMIEVIFESGSPEGQTGANQIVANFSDYTGNIAHITSVGNGGSGQKMMAMTETGLTVAQGAEIIGEMITIWNSNIADNNIVTTINAIPSDGYILCYNPNASAALDDGYGGSSGVGAGKVHFRVHRSAIDVRGSGIVLRNVTARKGTSGMLTNMFNLTEAPGTGRFVVSQNRWHNCYAWSDSQNVKLFRYGLSIARDVVRPDGTVNGNGINETYTPGNVSECYFEAFRSFYNIQGSAIAGFSRNGQSEQHLFYLTSAGFCRNIWNNPKQGYTTNAAATSGAHADFDRGTVGLIYDTIYDTTSVAKGMRITNDRGEPGPGVRVAQFVCSSGALCALEGCSYYMSTPHPSGELVRTNDNSCRIVGNSFTSVLDSSENHISAGYATEQQLIVMDNQFRGSSNWTNGEPAEMRSQNRGPWTFVDGETLIFETVSGVQQTLTLTLAAIIAANGGGSYPASRDELRAFELANFIKANLTGATAWANEDDSVIFINTISRGDFASGTWLRCRGGSFNNRPNFAVVGGVTGLTRSQVNADTGGLVAKTTAGCVTFLGNKQSLASNGNTVALHSFVGRRYGTALKGNHHATLKYGTFVHLAGVIDASPPLVQTPTTFSFVFAEHNLIDEPDTNYNVRPTFISATAAVTLGGTQIIGITKSTTKIDFTVASDPTTGDVTWGIEVFR